MKNRKKKDGRNEQNPKDLWNSIKLLNICLIKILEERIKIGAQKLYE